jgi:hypothetical protein
VKNFVQRILLAVVCCATVLKKLVSVIGGDVPNLHDLDFPYYVGKPPATGE